MHRRGFLERGCVVVATVGLSGCTVDHLQEAERDPPAFDDVPGAELDLPVRQRLGVAAAAIERAATGAVGDRDELVETLSAHGIAVERLEAVRSAGEETLALEYVPGQSDGRGTMDRLGAVAGSYAALVDAIRDRAPLDVRLLDSRSDPFGEFEVRPDWAGAYTAGDATAREYAKEIAVTLASA